MGGTVRDILLGEPGFDVDVVVEGDAIAVAEALARGTQRPRPHPPAVRHRRRLLRRRRARRRRHRAQRALRRTGCAADRRAATIEEDLRRRDFTINAMAVSLTGGEAGRLVDPFEGKRDLEAQPIRVLHDRSFIDDPTRIFRAIRYEDRLGFRMDEHTAALARSASRPDTWATSRAPACATSSCAARRGRRQPCDPRGSASSARRRRSSPRSWPTTRLVRALRPPAGAERGLRARGSDLAPRARRAGARTPGGARAWLDGLKVRRHGRAQLEAAVTAWAADRRAAPRAARSRLPRWSRSPSRTRRMRRSSRSRSRTRRRCATTSSASRRPARGRRLRPRRARAGGVAASGGDPRRAAPPQAERRARRPRLRARGGAGAARRVMIRWEHAPGPYVVAFTTRLGGVSGGAFESLNLGALTDDDPLNVDENRRLACAAVDADAATRDDGLAASQRRRHAGRAAGHRRGRSRRCDGLWTDEPGQPLMLLAADCLPIALGGRTAATQRWASCTPAGGACSTGSSPRARRLSAAASLAAIDRPGHRPLLLRGRRRGCRALSRRLRRRASCRRASSTSGARPSRRCGRPVATRSSAPTSAPSATPSSSSRTGATAAGTGRQGVAWPYRLRRSARTYERIRARARAGVTIVAATKYVARRRAGRPRRGRGRGRRREPARRTSRPSTPATATRSAGTSSATCRAERPRP